MPRGLGKNQRMILDVLNERDKPVSVMDLARHKTGTEDPPRSARVAMRRSAKALADRERIVCKRVPPQLRREKNSLLYCWLPSHSAPWLTPPSEVQGDPTAAVWDAVERFRALPDNEWYSEWGLYAHKIPEGVSAHAEDVPYSYVMSKAIKALGGHMHENPHATAVYRACRSLESEGKLTIHRNANGTAWAVSVVL